MKGLAIKRELNEETRLQRSVKMQNKMENLLEELREFADMIKKDKEYITKHGLQRIKPEQILQNLENDINEIIKNNQ